MEGTGDAPTIQAAVDSCTHGDTVLVMSGLYAGEGNRDIDFLGKSIVVMSLLGAGPTVIDCGGSGTEPHRGFIFHGGEDSTTVLRGFTVMNGYETVGGAVLCSGASPLIEGNIFDGNTGSGGGGAIACESSHAIIRGNTILNNTGSMYLAAQRHGERQASTPVEQIPTYGMAGGGGISCLNDSSLITNNTLESNYSTWGSAISCTLSEIIIKDNLITGNGNYQVSGTVNCTEGSYSITNNTISDNQGWCDGAGLYCSGGQYSITGNVINNNRAFCQSYGRGGGMYCGAGEYDISNNEIIANYGGGGGIWISGTGSIHDNNIIDNYADLCGPCLTKVPLEPAAPATDEVGGGISVIDTDDLVISENVIARNYSSLGGGIYCSGSSPEILFNLIYRNGASHNDCGFVEGGRGGGIYCSMASPVIMGNTIVSNRVNRTSETDFAAGGGIFCISGSSPVIIGNIISDNIVMNSAGSGGIHTADSASMPSVSFCDLFNNTNSDYGGYIDDQTGLNGNFSMTPLFCDPWNDDYHLHELSPCQPGHHPFIEEYGLIGALGFGCDFVETTLQAYSAEFTGAAVKVTWTLAERGADLGYSVYRSSPPDECLRRIKEPAVSGEDNEYSFFDYDLEEGTSYRYMVNILDETGEYELFSTSPVEIPKAELRLLQNFPNPFNPSTTIRYSLAESGYVNLSVFDVSGKPVASIIDGKVEKGWHQAVWNGHNDKGELAVSGIYLLRLTAGKNTISRKMVLLR
jgi:hypothetical protein